MKISSQVLTISMKPQIWSFHVILFLKMAKKMHEQSMQSYCFCSLKYEKLMCDVLVA